MSSKTCVGTAQGRLRIREKIQKFQFTIHMTVQSFWIGGKPDPDVAHSELNARDQHSRPSHDTKSRRHWCDSMPAIEVERHFGENVAACAMLAVQLGWWTSSGWLNFPQA
ncbi:hypothetical protein ACU8KH_05824 [Lachancea thermotolerans]